MKKITLIAGIIFIIIGIIALLYAALMRSSYYGLLDGSADMYRRLRIHMIVSFIIGILLEAGGILTLIFRSRF